MLLVAHIIVFFGNLFRIHETGRMVGLRYLYSQKLFNLEELLTHYLHLLLLTLSVAFFWTHSDNCWTWRNTSVMPGLPAS